MRHYQININGGFHHDYLEQKLKKIFLLLFYVKVRIALTRLITHMITGLRLGLFAVILTHHIYY